LIFLSAFWALRTLTLECGVGRRFGFDQTKAATNASKTIIEGRLLDPCPIGIIPL
jgi:hypothetical protein